MKRWRLFERKGEDLCTLFHGVGGSRRLPRGVWLDADTRTVHDGTNGTPYRGGFHVFGAGYGREYLRAFTKPRDLVRVLVEVDGVRAKPTNPRILLADRMRIPEDAEVVPVRGRW